MKFSFTQFSLIQAFLVLTLACAVAAMIPGFVRDFCELYLLPFPSWLENRK